MTDWTMADSQVMERRMVSTIIDTRPVYIPREQIIRTPKCGGPKYIDQMTAHDYRLQLEALTAAATIEPDVVFLLSDGRIQGTGVLVCC